MCVCGLVINHIVGDSNTSYFLIGCVLNVYLNGTYKVLNIQSTRILTIPLYPLKLIFPITNSKPEWNLDCTCLQFLFVRGNQKELKGPFSQIESDEIRIILNWESCKASLAESKKINMEYNYCKYVKILTCFQKSICAKAL